MKEKNKLNQGVNHKWQLKILLLCWEYPPNVVGGLSNHVFHLANQMACQGHEVHVLTAGKDTLYGYEMTDKVHVHRVKPINEHDDHFLSWIGGLNLAMAFKGEQLAEEIKFDIIHAHDWLVGAAAIALKKVLEIPLLTTIHATEYGRNNGIHNRIQRFIHEREKSLISSAEQLIVCSDYMKESLTSIFHIEEKKAAVIPNGIEPASISLKADEIFPELNGRKYIFSIGRMVKEKGFETLLKAAQIVKERNQDYFFVTAGKGPMLDTYQRQVKDLNLSNYLVFVGNVSEEERDALIHGSEIVVIPSLYEPFGIVTLEAMIQEKPVIVSNTGGMKGIVKHTQTGLVMTPGDPESLLKQIDFIRNNGKIAKEMGLKGGKAARSLYGWPRIAAETTRVMEDTILNIRANANGTPNNLTKV